MDEQIKERLSRRSVWVRALFMVIFALAYAIAEFLVWVVAVVQFFVVLFTGGANERLLQFGNNLSAYAWQVLRYVTFNSETQPFPFNDWPDEEVGENPWAGELPEEPESDG